MDGQAAIDTSLLSNELDKLLDPASSGTLAPQDEIQKVTALFQALERANLRDEPAAAEHLKGN